MKAKIAYSQKNEIAEIVADIKNQIGTFDAKLIQFFASSTISPQEISAAMQNAFPTIPMLGCTTAGEIVSGKMLNNSLVAMALGAEIVNDCKIEILTHLDTDEQAVDKAFASFANYYQTPMYDLDSRTYVGLLLIDGLSHKEEKINERIGDLTNVTFIGGSAGDDLQFKQTYVYANGKTYTNAAIVALLKCNTEFDVLKTQSFKATSTLLIPNKVDENHRTIVEFNNKPAVEEYARLVGIDKKNISEAFFTHPLGLGFGEDIYVRSPQKTDGDKIVFFCAMKANMELILLEGTDIVEDTQKSINEKLQSLGEISAIIDYHCTLRTLELKAKNKTQVYGEIFKDIPTIGFSTYGESYIGHINQTSTMLLFK